MSDYHLELVCNARANLGEGPLWDYRNGCLYWVDIQKAELHIFDPAVGSDRRVALGVETGCVALRSAGGLVLAAKNGFAAIDLETEEKTPLLDPEHHLRDNRFNDGKCDPSGRFWAGTMSMTGERQAGSLYCLFPDLTVRTMVTGVTTSNGLAWAPNQNTMYYIDTGEPEIWAFDYDDETGEIGNRRAVITVPDDMGKPDGMTIDEEGMLWVALWGGGAISRWDPNNGKLIDKIAVPAPHTTCCAFGGLKMDELYITTARSRMEKGQLHAFPTAGGLFRLEPGVRGTREPMFAG